MNENPFNKIPQPNKPEESNPNKREQLDVKIEIASEKDWKDYKEIRVEAIDNDIEVFGKYFKHEAPKERERSDQEWKDDLENSIIVLSKNGPKIIGVVKGVKSPNVEDVDIWRINSVYLNPDFRKKAIGENIAEKMLGMVLEEIKSKGAIKVRLWVLSKRSPAIGLYEKFGFKKINSIKALPIMGYNPKYLSEWQIMELELAKQEDKI